MATYVLLSTLTPEGRQTLHAHPERVAEVNQEIAEFGPGCSSSTRCWAPMTS